MKNAKKMTRNSAKADRKHAAGLFMAIVLMAALLTACGFGKKIYEDDRLNAMLTEADGRIDLSVRIRSSAVPMQEKIREKLTAGELYHEFETLMSDGVSVGYEDGTLDQGGGVYIYVYSSEAELEQVLEQSLPNSSGISWPEGENNFMLMYEPDNGTEEEDGSETVSIRAAEVPETVTGAGLRVSWSAYLHYGTEAGSATSSLSDVTEDVVYEAYTSAQDRSMDLFVDEGSGQALVILLEDGAYYTWSLTGKLTMDSVKTFADTIVL